MSREGKNYPCFMTHWLTLRVIDSSFLNVPDNSEMFAYMIGMSSFIPRHEDLFSLVFLCSYIRISSNHGFKNRFYFISLSYSSENKTTIFMLF